MPGCTKKCCLSDCGQLLLSVAYCLLPVIFSVNALNSVLSILCPLHPALLVAICPWPSALCPLPSVLDVLALSCCPEASALWPLPSAGCPLPSSPCPVLLPFAGGHLLNIALVCFVHYPLLSVLQIKLQCQWAFSVCYFLSRTW